MAEKSQVKRQPSHSQAQESSSQGSRPLGSPNSTVVCLGLSETDGPAPGSSCPPCTLDSPRGVGSHQGAGSLLLLRPPNKAALSAGAEDPSAPPQAPERRLYLCPRPDCWEAGRPREPMKPGSSGRPESPGYQCRERLGTKGCLGGAAGQSPTSEEDKTTQAFPSLLTTPAIWSLHRVVTDMALCAVPVLWEKGGR